MVKIGFVTDSSSDIPIKIAKELGIEIVPLYIGIDDKIYKDIYEITPEEVYNALRKGKKVTTASPSSGDFKEVFDRMFGEKNFDHIFCIVLSSKLSGTINAAHIAKKFYSEDTISVVDSKTSTICHGFIVIQAAEAAKAGYSVEELNKLIKNLVDKNKFFAVLESFEYVFKGGRAVFFSKMIEKAIKVVPILNIGKNGKVRLKKFAKNKKSAMFELYKQALAAAKMNESNRIGIFYGEDIRPAKELKELLKKSDEIRITDIIITKITTVISAHTGPGLWGIAISPKLIWF